MGAALASWIVIVASTYLGLGVVFAVPFVIRGIGRIDPAARGGSRGFRIIVFPGVVALWPVMLVRWWSGASRPPVERNAHRIAAPGTTTGPESGP